MRLDPVEEARRNPDRYLAGYPGIVLTSQEAQMSLADFERLDRNAGHYDGTLPTGVVPGKMWLRRVPAVARSRSLRRPAFAGIWAHTKPSPTTIRSV